MRIFFFCRSIPYGRKKEKMSKGNLLSKGTTWKANSLAAAFSWFGPQKKVQGVQDAYYYCMTKSSRENTFNCTKMKILSFLVICETFITTWGMVQIFFLYQHAILCFWDLSPMILNVMWVSSCSSLCALWCCGDGNNRISNKENHPDSFYMTKGGVQFLCYIILFWEGQNLSKI